MPIEKIFGRDNKQLVSDKLNKNFSEILTLVPAVRIAVLGGSASAHNPLWPQRWTGLLETTLNNLGGNVQVRSFAVNGHSAFRMMNTVTHGTRTAAQAAVMYAPNVVIVSAGYNDAVNKVDGRTIGQTQADSLALFTYLRAQLPSALIYYSYEQGYDDANFSTPGTTLKNKGVAPQIWTLPSTGYRANLWSNEESEVSVGAATLTKFADWLTWHGYTLSLSQLTGVVGIQFWRAARLGTMGPDGVHSVAAGEYLLCGYMLKALKAQTAFRLLVPAIADAVIAAWQDPDTLFTSLLTASGDGWVAAFPTTAPGGTSTSDGTAASFGPFMALRPDAWIHPYKASVILRPCNPALTYSNTAGSINGLYALTVTNAQPSTACTLSIDATAFISLGINTDVTGSFSVTGQMQALGLSTGAHTLRFKVGSSSFDPIAITVVA